MPASARCRWTGSQSRAWAHLMPSCRSCRPTKQAGWTCRRSLGPAESRARVSASGTSCGGASPSPHYRPRIAPSGCASRPTRAIRSRPGPAGSWHTSGTSRSAGSAVEPRTAYEGLLRNNRVPWMDRTEDKNDDSVWAVTCCFTRAGFRRRGVNRALVRAAVDFARQRGARAVEGYPMTTTNVILEELHVGTLATFEAAGFTEVSRPTLRRAVLRIDSLTIGQPARANGGGVGRAARRGARHRQARVRQPARSSRIGMRCDVSIRDLRRVTQEPCPRIGSSDPGRWWCPWAVRCGAWRR